MKIVGLHFNEAIHHLDHLGPLCAGLEIPLFLNDRRQLELGKKYYPHLDLQLVEESLDLPEQLSLLADTFIYSNFCGESDFSEYFKSTGKKVRSLYCPHGNSDKGLHYYWMENFQKEAFVLVYGQRMLDFLEEKRVRLKNYVVVGNYRLSYYLQNREFYKKLVEEEVCFPNKQKTLLYAPTWNVEDTTFFSSLSSVLDCLPDHYNLIVKLHPMLFNTHLGFLIQLQAKYEKRRNLLFLNDFPLIYPLLDLVDVYIGDMSSIGYDFLYFNKPLFFLSNNQELSASSPLHQRGVVLYRDTYDTLYSRLEESDHFEEKRKELYLHTFGEHQSFDQIKNKIHRMLDVYSIP